MERLIYGDVRFGKQKSQCH